MSTMMRAGIYAAFLLTAINSASASDLTGLTESEVRAIFPDIAVQERAAVPAGRYGSLIARVSKALGMDAFLVDAVIYRESNYRADVVSSANAIGLMQLVPDGGAADAYAHLYGRAGQPTQASLMRPDINVWLGTAYLQLLERQYFSDYAREVRIPLVLAAYNWGIGRMLHAKPPQMLTRGEVLDWIDRHCPDETKSYVTRVLSSYDSARVASL
ncbi:transglycosylase SLT domain-containing protein [Salinisphaera sp. T31B1]|uniref:transglycosylase SLT domain-containing protein n=1 Tax=Salinisphaera sp. T31B1 TaxID=727963 RepID=UPI00333E1A83